MNLTLSKDIITSWTKEDGRDLCVACVVLPSMAFGAGVGAVYFPIPVLSIGMALGGISVVAFYRLMSDRSLRELHTTMASASSMVALSVLSGFGCGLIAAGPAAAFDGLSMMMSFAFGLIGGILYRQHRRALKRAEVIESSRSAA